MGLNTGVLEKASGVEKRKRDAVEVRLAEAIGIMNESDQKGESAGRDAAGQYSVAGGTTKYNHTLHPLKHAESHGNDARTSSKSGFGTRTALEVLVRVESGRRSCMSRRTGSRIGIGIDWNTSSLRGTRK